MHTTTLARPHGPSGRPSTSAVGVPSLADYHALVRSPEFAEIERFSAEFLATHADALAPYARKWVRDPLHQWSRQWEYPYVADHVDAHGAAAAGQTMRILDAGSGVTFFPYLLASRPTVGEVHCVDSDDSLEEIYAEIASRSAAPVRFTTADLSSLPFDDGSFQVVYCISVLEHTENYPQIIREFYRVLERAGLLVVTFDISIDGDRDISIDGAQGLLDELRTAFGDPAPAPPFIADIAKSQEILTTRAIAKHDRSLLPWRPPLRAALTSLRKARLPKRWTYPNLTCYCGTFTKSL
jgi:SAM-dependent methyltransferase